MKRNSYKYLFYIFNFSGIFLNNNNDVKQIRNRKIGNISAKILNALFNTIGSLHLLLCISYFFLYSSNSKVREIVFTFLNATYVLFRIYLSIYISHLNKVIKKINVISLKWAHKRNAQRILLIWISIVFIITIYIIEEYTKRIFNDNKTIQALYFGYPIENVFIKFFLALIYTLNYTLILYLPLHTFDFFYVMICLDISSLLDKFRLFLKISKKHDYVVLTDIYKEIVSVTEYFDNSVGFLTFASFLNSAVLMYYGLETLLTNSNNNKYDDIILMTCALNLISFIIKIESASRINASSILAKSESRDLQENNYKNVCVYMRFIKKCKEINMTVWGFINLK